MKVRELLTVWGFDVDDKALDNMDRKIERTKNTAAKLQRKFDAVGRSALGMGKRMTLFATLPIAALGGVMLKSASEAEETAGKFDIVFGDLAASTRGWIDEQSKAMGRSKIDMEGYLAGLQDLFEPLGFTAERSAELSKQISKLGIDLASFNDQADPDAINALTSALVGSHETVKRYGVILNDVTLSAELLRMGITGGMKAANEQQKVQARVNLIMKNTSKAHDNAADTLGSFANSVKELQGDFKDLSAELGAIFLPYATRVVHVVTGLINWFGNLSEGTKKVILIVAGLVAIVGPLLIGFGLIAISIGALIPLLAVAAKWFAGLTIAAFAVPLAIAAVVAGLAIFFDDLYNWINGGESLLGEWLGSWEDWSNGVLGFIGTVKDELLKAWDELGNVLGYFGIGNTTVNAAANPASSVSSPSGTVNRSNSNSSNINATVTVNVPPGTPESQAAYLEKAANTSFNEVMNKQVQSSLDEFPEVG